MKAILGQYYYAPHRRSFGVWQWTEVSETGACGTFIKDFFTREQIAYSPRMFLDNNSLLFFFITFLNRVLRFQDKNGRKSYSILELL